MNIGLLRRHWTRLAPKLVAFLATGLTASGLLYVLAAFGVQIAPTLAVILVGGLSSVAAYIQRDNLLTLAPGQMSLKVLAFILTSATAAGVVALAAEFGLDLTPYSATIGIVLTAIAGMIGYVRSDAVIDAGTFDGTGPVTVTSLR